MSKTTQQSLFDTQDDVEKPSAPIHIKMSDTDDADVRKLKTSFKRGLLQIQKLKTEITSFDDTVQKLGERYQSQISPMLMELNKIQLAALDVLDAAYQKKSYTNEEREALREIILKEIDLFLGAGGTLPDRFHSYMVFPEEEKELLADMFKEQYGFEVDIDDIAGEKKLNEEDFRAKYQSFFGQNGAPEKKKTTSDFVDLRLHFMKIYKSLAKRVHPDLERNDKLRGEKEQLMQALTAAKESEDLFALLTLREKIDRMEKTESDLDETYLSLYLKKIKSEIKTLKNQLSDKKQFSGREAFLYQRYYAPSKKTETQRFNAHLKELKKEMKEYSEWMLHFRTVKSTKNYIEDYLIEQEFYNDPFMDFV